MFLRDSQHVPSYYSSNVEAQPRAAQTHDLQTEVLIIGVGFSGLHTGLRLALAGKKVTMIDASRIAWAASGRNGGMAILGWSSDMGPIEQALGLNDAKVLWGLMREAASELNQLPQRFGFDCNYRPGHLWASVLARRVAGLREWQEHAAHKWNYDSLQLIEKKDVPNWINSERYQAALYDPEAGHIHPLKLALGLAHAFEQAGGQIFEQTRAVSYQEVGNQLHVTTEHGQIKCDQLVLACNSYIDQLDAGLSRKILPVGTFMVTTEVLGQERAKALIPSNACVTDNQFILDYFRLTADHRLLFGGGCTYLGGIPADIPAAMRPNLERVFPTLKGVKIDYAWGGHIDISMHRTPEIGCRGNVYWMQGYSGHGVLPTCVSGRVVAEAILGQRDHLALFMRLSHPPFPGGAILAPWLEAAGKCWYRLRDFF